MPPRPGNSRGPGSRGPGNRGPSSRGPSKGPPRARSAGPARGPTGPRSDSRSDSRTAPRGPSADRPRGARPDSRPGARPGPRSDSRSAPRGPSDRSRAPRPAQRPFHRERPVGAFRPDSPRDPARETVFHHIAQQASRFPDLDIAPLDTSALKPLDAAFAHAIYDAVLRRWLTLEFLLSKWLEEDQWPGLEPRMKSALLVGAAQILFLDKVPVHAAVSESVTWAKSNIRLGAAGMVNAVLRRVSELIAADAEGHALKNEAWQDRREELPLEDGRSITLADPSMPADPLGRLAVATSHPIELLRAWSKAFPMRDVKSLALHGVGRPPIILNTAHMTRDADDRAAMPLTPDLAIPHTAPGHHVWKGSHEQLSAFLASRDDVWAQDPASSLAVQSVSDLFSLAGDGAPAPLILDICAGKGTKTRQLAAAFPSASIVATDIDRARFATLDAHFKGHPRVRIIPFGALDEFIGKADLVLIDAPCSNTGVLARRVEARYRYSEESARTLVATQKQIVADAVRLLKPPGATPAGLPGRGRILYSTCSLDPRENEEICAWAERWHALAPSRVRRRLPEGGPGQPPEKYSDGSFAALLG